MIKLFIGLFSVLAVASAGPYGRQEPYELASLEAPLLPKGGVVSYSYAQSHVQPLYQSPPPQQLQPLQPVYDQPKYTAPPQQQPPLQPYYAPQVPQQPPAQSYAPVAPPAQEQPSYVPQQQQPPAETYAPAAQAPPAQTYVPQQQQQPAPQTYQQPAQEQPSYVPQQQQPPAQTYAPAAQAPPAQSNYGPQPPPQQPPRPAEDFCQRNNLVEGYHGKGCKPYYFACNAYTTTRVFCPAGLFYDTQTQRCDYKNVIVACGGRPAPPPQQPPVQQPYAPAPQQQPSYPQQPAYTQPPAFNPPAIPDYDCKNKADGIYVVGCSDKYYICMLGTATTLTCPAGTFYSVKTERCDYKAHVVECGGILPPPAQNPPSQVPYGQVPQQPQPSYPQQQPPQPSYGQQQQQQQPSTSNQCANLENGIYGRKCSRHFVACSNYRTYEFMCPKGYAFNLKTVKCAPKNQIQTCPEYEIPQAQPPAPRPYDSQPLVPDYAPAQQSPAVPAPYAPQQPSYQQSPPVQQQYPQGTSY